MIKTLILPVAGRSSRFPGMRPKWLLTMPDGRLMFEHALKPLLDRNCFDQVVLVVLQEHLDQYVSREVLLEMMTACVKSTEQKGHRVQICVLEQATTSQPETVALAIEKLQLTGPIFIKDCDNTFEVEWGGENAIATMDLNSVGLLDAKNKSYVRLQPEGQNVIDIVEKQVISNHFCCGGYGFASAPEFLADYTECRKLLEPTDDGSNLYVSHVVYRALMRNRVFRKVQADRYTDWGTAREYLHYMRSFLTVFCDVDGVLFKNGSKFSGWDTAAIGANVRSLVSLQKQGRLFLVITSSRPESQQEKLAENLQLLGLKADRYIMGLPHTQRVLVNDFSPTNPFPSAVALNLERDSPMLAAMLDSTHNNRG